MNNNNTQQLIMTCPPINAVEDEFRFSNQYDDRNTLYTYDEKSNVLKVYMFLNLESYDFKLCMGKPDITRDQWNKFLMKMKLLSASVMSVFNQYTRTDNKLYCQFYTPSEPSASTDYYFVEYVSMKEIVIIKPISSKTNSLFIPFDPLLNKTIIRYRQELKNAMYNELNILN